jgi:hypothetical protein
MRLRDALSASRVSASARTWMCGPAPRTMDGYHAQLAGL